MALTRDASVLGLAWLLIVLVSATGYVCRRTTLAVGGVLAVQVLVLAGFVFISAAAGLATGQSWSGHVMGLWTSGIEHMQNQSAPMAPNSGVRLIFLTAVSVLMVLTDLVVVGLARPALGAALPAAASLAPAMAVGVDVGLVSFVCSAGALLTILVAEGLVTAERWTRGLSGDSSHGRHAGLPMVWRAAAFIAVPAVTGAVVLGGAAPTLALSSLGLGKGLGLGPAMQLSDPTLDLRRNLNQPADRVVIEYQTDQPGGVYLRMASLPVFDSAGWSNAPTQLATGQTLPAIPGVDNEPAQRRRTTIRVLDFRSEYLPLPYAPRQIAADGSWAYDPNSLMVVAGGGRTRADPIQNSTYTVESVDIVPNRSQLAGALPGTPADASLTAAVPPDLPASLRTLTRQVTATAPSAAEKAAAIQAYLRSDRFTYSTEPLPGTGYQALENFLLKDRRGYCEQFATSMAMMARVVGIPTRVAVGFLPGRPDGDTWRVGIRNMHAWPELYFAGFGWVRFEPTPSAVTGTAPAWTVPQSEPGGQPSVAPTAEPSAAGPSVPTRPDDAPNQAPVGERADSSVAWRRVLLLVVGGLVMVTTLALPAVARHRRRSGRLTDDLQPVDRVEAAWAEIRDTVIDHGESWPQGSPRMIGDELSRRLEETQSLSQLAALVERSRYARAFTDTEATRPLPRLTSDIRQAIAERSNRRTRILASVLPRSLVRRPTVATRFRAVGAPSRSDSALGDRRPR